MKRKVIVGLVFLIFVSSPLSGDEGASRPGENPSPLRDILERYRQLLQRIEKPDAAPMDALVGNLDEAGRWPDIDYADKKRGMWSQWEHVKRLREISLALSLGGTDRLSESDLESAAMRALDHWLANRYQAPNWWHNQIGIPRSMRDTAILLEGRLDPARRAGLLEVIAQYGTVRATGANLLWLGEIALHYGCLTGDVERVSHAAEQIRGEIAVGKPEGIQDDWSFFQHGARLQTFAYGLSYVQIALPLGWQLRGSPWEYSSDEVLILSNLLLEGAQWMMRGTFTVPSTMDRSASRPGRLKVDLLPYVELWSEVDSARRADLEQFARRLAGMDEWLAGFRHFRRADFTAYHRPGFSFFVKTVSDRTLLTESINDENLLGRNLGTGDHYLVRTGREYFDLMPVWDWERLPGIATADGLDQVERRPFTGGIGDESSGFAVMDLERVNAKGGAHLKVRRSWFFHGDTIVVLVGGWDWSGAAAAPYVVLDQSRLQGEVSCLDASGELRRLEAGEHELESPLALLHDGVAWFPINASRISLRLGPAGGSWQKINRNQSDTPVSEPVFLASIDYSGGPEAGGFAVVPGIAVDQARRLAQRPSWTVARNDRSVQAVEFEGDISMTAFFESGTVKLGRRELSASVPCLIFRRGEVLLAADPTMKGGPVEIQWNGTKRTIELPAGGGAVSWE